MLGFESKKRKEKRERSLVVFRCLSFFELFVLLLCPSLHLFLSYGSPAGPTSLRQGQSRTFCFRSRSERPRRGRKKRRRQQQQQHQR